LISTEQPGSLPDTSSSMAGWSSGVVQISQGLRSRQSMYDCTNVRPWRRQTSMGSAFERPQRFSFDSLAKAASSCFWKHASQTPANYEDFEACLDAYEQAHFAWDEGGRRVSDATLALMTSWYPRPLAPLLRTGTLALLDEPLLRAFGYAPPSPAIRAIVRRAVRLRGRAVRLLPPRRAPHHARQNREIKGYPNGYRLAELGTRPVPGVRGCPVRHIDTSAAE
jgi:hypothetical protein